MNNSQQNQENPSQGNPENIQEMPIETMMEGDVFDLLGQNTKKTNEESPANTPKRGDGGDFL